MAAEGQEVLPDCNLNKSQEMERMDNAEDIKEHNQSNEEVEERGRVEPFLHPRHLISLLDPTARKIFTSIFQLFLHPLHHSHLRSHTSTSASPVSLPFPVPFLHP